MNHKKANPLHNLLFAGKRPVLFIVLLLALFISKSYAQSWNKTSPTILYGTDKHGDTSDVKVGIGTANPQAPLHVKGEIMADSIKLSRIIPIDSVIHFGAGSDGIAINNASNIISWTAGGLTRCGRFLTNINGLGIGNGSTIAVGVNSMALGTNVQIPCSVTQAMVLGAGISNGRPLINNISNSMMIGFNSTAPTVYVGPSAGGITTGKVGIGTTTPLTALHVATTASTPGLITSDPLSGPGTTGPAAAGDGLVIANANGTMYTKLAFSGNSNQVLLGNGTFGSVPNGGGGSGNAWVLGGNNNVTVFNNTLGTLTGFDLKLIAGGNTHEIIKFNTGFVGMDPTGTAFTPNHALDVNNGDIDVNTATSGYMINSNYVLWHNGNTTDINVGVNAGNTTSGAQSWNTFVGSGAGQNNAGDSCTFVGYNSGNNNQTRSNTFVGGLAGTANTSGFYNTFIGEQAGLHNNNGSYNVFTGYAAGKHNISGVFNTFTGVDCGFNNTVGHHNEFYGKKAGFSNISGADNCYYGTHCDYWNQYSDSNAMFGSQAAMNELGSGNVMLGFEVGSYGGFSTSNSTPYTSHSNVFVGSYAAPNCIGNGNIVIGAFADANGNLNNSVAIGYKAAAEFNNNFILGNNNQLVGIGLSANSLRGPQANLEISTDQNTAAPVGPYPTPDGFLGHGFAISANPYGGTGFSGLKFRDLTSNSIPVATNPGPGALGLDQYGNVIYIPLNPIGTCAAPTLLTNDGDIALNKHNFYFDNSNAVTGENDVIIGTSCGVPPVAKLYVDNVLENQAIYASTTKSTSAATYGIWTISMGSTTDNDGVFSQALGSSPENDGVRGIASNATSRNIGGTFGGDGSAGPSGTTNWGVTATGSNGVKSYGIDAEAIDGTTTNIGAYGDAYGPSTSSNFGVYGNALGGVSSYGTYGSARFASNNYGLYGTAYGSAGSGNYGVYGTTLVKGGNNYAGFFDGDVFVSGPMSGTGYLKVSDSVYKTHVGTINKALSILTQLKPDTFYYDTNNPQKLRFNSSKHYGFIAQDINWVLPGLVQNVVEPTQYDSAGNVTAVGATIGTIDYTEFTAILTKGVQEQQLSIDSLRKRGSAGFMGTTNYVPKFTSATTLGNSAIFQTGNNVGINTTTPAGLFDISNGSNSEVTVMDNGGSGRFQIKDNSGNPYVEFNNVTAPGHINNIQGDLLINYLSPTRVNGLGVAQNLVITTGTSGYTLGSITDNSGYGRFTLYDNSGNAFIEFNNNSASGHISNIQSDLLIGYLSPTLIHGFGVKGNILAVNSSNSATFAVNGGSANATLQYVDGNQAAGKVLTSDANGNATWQNVSGSFGGTTNYITKFSSANSLANSSIFDNGTNIVFGGGTPVTPSSFLDVLSSGISLTIDNPTTHHTLWLFDNTNDAGTLSGYSAGQNTVNLNSNDASLNLTDPSTGGLLARLGSNTGDSRIYNSLLIAPAFANDNFRFTNNTLEINSNGGTDGITIINGNSNAPYFEASTFWGLTANGNPYLYMGQAGFIGGDNGSRITNHLVVASNYSSSFPFSNNTLQVNMDGGRTDGISGVIGNSNSSNYEFQPFVLGTTATDDGHLNLSAVNGGTVQLNSNGVSLFNGGNVGIGTTGPGYPLQVEANGASVAAYFDGNVYTTGSYQPSDSTLKTNITNIQNCGNILCRLKPRTFVYDTSSHKNLGLPAGTHYGLIAQDVQPVLPDLVKTITRVAVKDTAGNIVEPAVSFKGVNYVELVPLLIKGYQDQQKTIDSLKEAFKSVQACLNKVCDKNHSENTTGGTGNESNTQNVTLSSVNSAILYQNSPNPFSTGTQINYYLPDGTMSAVMVFFDMYGNKIKEVPLQQTGMGTINITPDNLKDGVYSYSLLINGQLIDTKKMVLQK